MVSLKFQRLIIALLLIAGTILPNLNAIATTDTGNDTANSLRDVMALVISLTVLLGAVGFIVYAVTLEPTFPPSP